MLSIRLVQNSLYRNFRSFHFTFQAHTLFDVYLVLLGDLHHRIVVSTYFKDAPSHVAFGARERHKPHTGIHILRHQDITKIRDLNVCMDLKGLCIIFLLQEIQLRSAIVIWT